MIDVRVEKPPSEYACPLTKTVVPASFPSGATCTRLGTPASGSSPRGLKWSSNSTARYVVKTPAIRRQADALAGRHVHALAAQPLARGVPRSGRTSGETPRMPL